MTESDIVSIYDWHSESMNSPDEDDFDFKIFAFGKNDIKIM